MLARKPISERVKKSYRIAGNERLCGFRTFEGELKLSAKIIFGAVTIAQSPCTAKFRYAQALVGQRRIGRFNPAHEATCNEIFLSTSGLRFSMHRYLVFKQYPDIPLPDPIMLE